MAATVEVSRGSVMKPILRLRSHTGSILCCDSPRSSPHTLVSSSEDGSVCVFDLRTQSCSMRLQLFCGEPVASICLKPGDDNQLYAAAGAVVHYIELRLGSSGSCLHKYEFNTDEINQVSVNKRATFVAAADDSGEIKVIDLSNHKLYKTLRAVHQNICSAVQFHAQKPWEAISGGLDSKLVKWDISKGKELKEIDLFASTVNVGQLCNPPFVHALAVPEGDCPGETGRLLAVARGDGAVEVYDSNFVRSKSSRSKTQSPSRRRSSGRIMANEGAGEEKASSKANGIKCHLDSGQGGHSTAVSSVTFARFGDMGRYLLSGGNDALVKVWDWAIPVQEESLEEQGGPLVVTIQHRKKINWLSTIDNSSGNIVVADTSKVLSLYHVL